MSTISDIHTFIKIVPIGLPRVCINIRFLSLIVIQIFLTKCWFGGFFSILARSSILHSFPIKCFEFHRIVNIWRCFCLCLFVYDLQEGTEEFEQYWSRNYMHVQNMLTLNYKTHSYFCLIVQNNMHEMLNSEGITCNQCLNLNEFWYIL